MSELAARAGRNLEAIRERKPLVHNITNYVVMDVTANALLALGASPVMAHAKEEMVEMASLAQALVLNIGTLSRPWIEAMLVAGETASRSGKPIVLDPVGAGATKLRTETAKRILAETKVSLIRGNASEILALADADSQTKGVDSVHSVDQATEAARALAKELGVVLAVTGAVDLVTDGQRAVKVENGHPLMAYVTGTGCTATAMTAAFAAVDDDPIVAAATGLAFFGLAGQIAAENCSGPGGFRVALIDALYNITPDQLVAGARLTEAGR